MRLSIYIRQIRPLHILKNFAILLPAFYYGYIFNKTILYELLWVFVKFTFAAFIIYTINDIFDRKEDKRHPRKRFRPIPNGELKIPEAIMLIIVLSVTLVFLNIIGPSPKILFLILLFIFINILYSWRLKKFFLIDAITVSTGFILRIIAGFECIHHKPDINMLLWIFTIAILVALAKRIKRESRDIESHSVMNIYLILSPLSIILNFLFLINLHLPIIIILSVFFHMIGILRFYYYLIKINNHLSPFEILLNDSWLFLIVLINTIFCFKVIYL
ncbi:MAG: UbiA family prenyltransferase [Myxococcota bacterium]